MRGATVRNVLDPAALNVAMLDERLVFSKEMTVSQRLKFKGHEPAQAHFRAEQEVSPASHRGDWYVQDVRQRPAFPGPRSICESPVAKKADWSELRLYWGRPSGRIEPSSADTDFGRAWTKTLFIEPGSPWENGYNESFKSKLSDELLNVELFNGLEAVAEKSWACDIVMTMDQPLREIA